MCPEVTQAPTPEVEAVTVLITRLHVLRATPVPRRLLLLALQALCPLPAETQVALLVVSAFARDETIINKAQLRQSESDYLVSKSQVEQLLATFCDFGNEAMTGISR